MYGLPPRFDLLRTHPSQAKSLHIDELLSKLDSTNADVERLGDEKDLEILTLQEELHSTIKQLSEAQQVSSCEMITSVHAQLVWLRNAVYWMTLRPRRLIPSFSTTKRNSMKLLVSLVP